MKTKKIYQFSAVEEKWQKEWQEANLYQAINFDRKHSKYYVLVEFPYPSGEGLHIGHTFTMTGADIYARKKRMEGKNVLFPMGWDAFGLPTENYAVKTGTQPQIITKRNTDTFRRQMKKMAFSFDWSREINTTDSAYYHWTQWIFVQLFKHGLAYKKAMPINWCPSCKIGLANEEVINGRCERCGEPVERRQTNQWVVKITKYADRLINGLKKTDFIEKVKAAQINWIGRSEGARVKFKVQSSKFKVKEIEIFTTRPDTLWGATFMVIAPEHPLVNVILSEAKDPFLNSTGDSSSRRGGTQNDRIGMIKDYVQRARKKSDLERTELEKDKTGVFSGFFAINPVNNKKIPIWVADFVLASYGTGAIMAVPAHDERDWQFAKKYGLEIVPVVKPKNGDWDYNKRPFVNIDDAVVFNSDFLNGMPALKAKEKIIDYLVKKKWGRRAVNYHLRDWIFSRQHYWGEPIPMVFCELCSQKIKSQTNSISQVSNDQKERIREIVEYAKRNKINLDVLLSNPGWVPVLERDLPVELPKVEKYQPTDTGESPLASVKDWVKVKCPVCGGSAQRETDTMPNWAGSDWYYLAYCFADKLKKLKNSKTQKFQNSKRFRNSQDIFSVSKNILSYWLPVDVYIGGDEHNTLHLLYSRFIYQFLHDIGAVPKGCPEPYYKRISHGVILGTDGQRMSKSRGNIISPDKKWGQWGVDALRMYLMFIGPFEGTMAWNENALKGVARFLEKFTKLIAAKDSLSLSRTDRVGSLKVKTLINKLIKKVSNDIDRFQYNTAIAAMMETINKLEVKSQKLKIEDLGVLVRLLAPFAPYLAEELWCEVLGNKFSVHQQPWPTYNKKLLVSSMSTIVVQMNGRLRAKIDIESDIANDKDEVILRAKQNFRIKRYLVGKKIEKVIFVPGRLVNFVVK